MSQTHEEDSPTSVELSEDLLHRIDGIVHRMQGTALSRQLRVTRALIIRMALLQGLEQLEKTGQAE